MPYRKTVFANNHFYHIYNRGVAKQLIFLGNQDKYVFLKRINQFYQEVLAVKKQKIPLVSIHVFCLMPNHFHLIVRQEKNNGITIFLRKLATSYAMYFNKKYDRVGPLFQGRFKAKLVDKDEYIIHLSRYIHLNPLLLVSSPEKLETYPFSSLTTYLGNKKSSFLDTSFILSYFENELKEFKSFTLASIDEFVLIQDIKQFLLEEGRAF